MDGGRLGKEEDPWRGEDPGGGGSLEGEDFGGGGSLDGEEFALHVQDLTTICWRLVMT